MAGPGRESGRTDPPLSADGKLYDAYISYSNSPEDRKFVNFILKPQLERHRGYKLFLDDRDLLPRAGTGAPPLSAWAPPPLVTDPASKDILNHGLPLQGFPGSSDGKESACNARDPGSIPGLGRCPGEGNGNPLQYSCLKNLKIGRAHV